MFENGWLARSFALCSHKNAAQPMLSKENVSCLQVTSFEHRIASEVASFRSFDVTKYSTQILKAKKAFGRIHSAVARLYNFSNHFE